MMKRAKKGGTLKSEKGVFGLPVGPVRTLFWQIIMKIRERMAERQKRVFTEITDLSLFQTGWMIELNNPAGSEHKNTFKMLAGDTPFYEQKVLIPAKTTGYMFGDWSDVNPGATQIICAEILE